MTLKGDAMRRRFLGETLGAAILENPAAFYDAFEDSEDAMEAYLTMLFETLCRESGEDLSTHSFFPQIEPYILEDTPDGFCALVTVTLPKTAAAREAAAAIVFGSAMDPRVFTALPVTLKHGDTLAVGEYRLDGERAVAVLHQGCDNDLQLFDPPSPQKRDPDTPLAVSRRAAAFVDTVVCYCMEHD